MTTTNCIPLQLLDICFIPNVYTVAIGINATGEGHDEGYHLHTQSNGNKPYTGYPYEGVFGCIGTPFQDEFERAIMKLDLRDPQSAPLAQLALLEFDITNVQQLPGGGNLPWTTGGLYGDSGPFNDPTVFIHDPPVPYSGLMRLSWFFGVDMSDDVDDANLALRPGTMIEEFQAAGFYPPHRFVLDITSAYNAARGSILGLRIEDTEEYPGSPIPNTWNQRVNEPEGEFGCDPEGTGIGEHCHYLVQHPGGWWDNVYFKLDGRGCMTTENYCIRITR